MPSAPRRIRCARTARLVAAALVVGALPAAALAEHALGDVVPSGVFVDLTTAGFGLLGALVADTPPVVSPVDPFTDSGQTGCVAGNCAFSYDLSLTNFESSVDVTSLTLATDEANQGLDLVGTGIASLNSQANPGILQLDVVFAFVQVFDDTCQVWVQPVDLDLTGDLDLAIVPLDDGTSTIDTTIPPVEWSWTADGDDIVFTGCQVADVINTVNDTLNLFGLDLYDILIAQLEPFVDDLVSEVSASLEPVADDVFGSLVVNQEVDVAGAPVTVEMWPDQVSVEDPDGAAGTPGGLRVGLATRLTAEVDPCVASSDVTGSMETPGVPPAIGTTPGLPFTPSMATLVSDDFADHFLYAVWQTGALCAEVTDGAAYGVPLPLDTSLLGVVAPGVFDTLFPEPAPLLIRIAPRTPPVLDMAAPDDADVQIDQLGFDLIAEVDGRDARVLGLDIASTVALALPYDATTGILTAVPSIEDVSGAVSYNELDPSATPTIDASLGLLIDLAVAPALEGALQGIDIPMPLLGESVGVTDVAVASADASDTWLGLFAATGPVGPEYSTAGCDATGDPGCDTTSCGTGCATGGVPGRLVMLLPLVAAGLRRRQSSQSRRPSSRG